MPTENSYPLLEEDVLTVPGQAVALISIVSPTSNQKTEQCGIKIRGVFSSAEAAKPHIEKLKMIDTQYDIYLVEMYKWLLIPPDPMAVQDQQYNNERLNDLITGYQKNQVMAKAHFEERKRMVMEEGLEKHLLPHEVIPRPAAATDGASTSALAASTSAEEDA